jgi:hypothetical protein
MYRLHFYRLDPINTTLVYLIDPSPALSTVHTGVSPPFSRVILPSGQKAATSEELSKMTLERKSTSQSIRSHRSAGGTLSEAIALSRTKSAVEGSEAGDGKIYPDSSDPLLGHLHHLTKEQETALETFKSTLIEKQLYTPAAEGKEASHDDSTLLYGIFFLGSSLSFWPWMVHS